MQVRPTVGQPCLAEGMKRFVLTAWEYECLACVRYVGVRAVRYAEDQPICCRCGWQQTERAIATCLPWHKPVNKRRSPVYTSPRNTVRPSVEVADAPLSTPYIKITNSTLGGFGTAVFGRGVDLSANNVLFENNGIGIDVCDGKIDLDGVEIR